MADCGGGPIALSGGSGEERPWGSVVGRRMGGGGAAGGRRGGTSTTDHTSSSPASICRYHGRWAIV